MGQFTMPENGEFSEGEMDKYVSGVRVYEERFEWFLNLSPNAGGGLDDAGSPVYFKKIAVTPDDERAWFKKHPSGQNPTGTWNWRCGHFFCFCRQAFPQKHGLAVGKPKQVGEHPMQNFFPIQSLLIWCRSLPLFWRDSKRKNKKANIEF